MLTTISKKEARVVTEFVCPLQRVLYTSERPLHENLTSMGVDLGDSVGTKKNQSVMNPALLAFRSQS